MKERQDPANPVPRPDGPLPPPKSATPRPGAPQAAAKVRYVMCPPTYLSNKIPNNVFMEEDKGPIDVDRALQQWDNAKHLIQALGTEVLEIPPVNGAQDQTFVSNVAVAIAPYIILANYKAPGRPIEVEPARQFFTRMGYQCIQPPFVFEGDAELKKLNDTTYIGGYGKFTDIRALDWIEQKTGKRIVKVRETNDKLYHLDCSLHVLDQENVIASPDGLDAASMKLLGSVAKVTVIPKGLASVGVTNGVKIADKKVYLSGTLQPEDPAYQKGIEWLLETFYQFGYVVTFLDTDAVNRSGADLSCQCMELNFAPSRAPVVARPGMPMARPQAPTRPVLTPGAPRGIPR
jgi:N-dimethylarginine dimethylaminohydrolase